MSSPEYFNGAAVNSGVENGGPRRYAFELTLDPNTVNNALVLSEGNRKVMGVGESQSYPDHPDRFDEWNDQVLCKESLTGQCYWEAQWSGHVYIAVSYKSINRKGGGLPCWFGQNKKSWSLECSDHSFTVWHDNNSTSISVPSDSSRTVGVFVDESIGSLSFYSVSDTHELTQLHTFNTIFTDTLYAGFTAHFGSSVTLCHV
nr:stonustoxin subunit beta-like [Danio rerio]|eukprot:XP_003201572.1 stonustoxin subunit beta-like [Danio rerio]